MITIASQKSVPKKLSFMSIYFLGINGVIGSGTFLLPSVIYRDMNLSAVAVLLCTAVTVSMIALCYADLSSRFTGSGAAWLYSYHAFGRFTGYELGIFTWFLGCCTLSAEIVALLTTLKSFLPIFNDPLAYGIGAFGLILLFALINFFGRGLVKLVNNISAAAKILTLIIFIVVGVFFIHKANFSPVIPQAALKGPMPFLHHFGAAFTPIFYLFTGFSFLPIAAKQMNKPEKNIPRVLIAVMVSVTILDALMMIVAVGLAGTKLGGYSTPLANALGLAIGKWGYAFIIFGMLVSIFGVAFSASFNTPSLIASMANEHGMLPKFIGKKNKHDAPWVGIILTSILSALFATQSYLFLVSCTVLASFVQYVPSILAVVKFEHSNEYPTHGFKLPGKYLIPILALLVSCYMVTNFTAKTLLVGTVVAIAAAGAYFFIKTDRSYEEKHSKWLAELRLEGKKLK
ncbi:APC family permease [Limosilactobacillus sp. STM2_1]|uniref:APC family permease n=2 Tax=Limosilactobacillus rudii TaxID=2759755 RepID=A0A7W3UL45_9LACO|nr:APC family permease [Limosilactobacillus rudii]MBB1079518.1 APC family permease [Limosilactobacillus rudii]MBB1097564.1 APC family permease [Limosilactobacillus rudii]MCD7134673.1 APC family permease [Limosilactobacillus rudii]